MGRAFTFYIYNFTMLFSLIILVLSKLSKAFLLTFSKISNPYSYFFVFFANRRKNRHKTRRRQFIFVTYLKLAPYIDTKTYILGCIQHT